VPVPVPVPVPVLVVRCARVDGKMWGDRAVLHDNVVSQRHRTCCESKTSHMALESHTYDARAAH